MGCRRPRSLFVTQLPYLQSRSHLRGLPSDALRGSRAGAAGGSQSSRRGAAGDRDPNHLLGAGSPPGTRARRAPRGCPLAPWLLPEFSAAAPSAAARGSTPPPCCWPGRGGGGKAVTESQPGSSLPCSLVKTPQHSRPLPSHAPLVEEETAPGRVSASLGVRMQVLGASSGRGVQV